MTTFRPRRHDRTGGLALRSLSGRAGATGPAVSRYDRSRAAPTRLETGADAVILKQYYLGCLAHASYLIADQTSGQAAVIDPQRDVEQYIADADELGCRIGHVFLT